MNRPIGPTAHTSSYGAEGPPGSAKLASVEPLLERPIGFAHRGARADAPENTLEAFALALRLGATGLESDVWLTADGVAVLDHDGLVRTGLGRRRPIASIPRAELPSHIPALADLYQQCGTAFELSLDVKHDPAGPVAVAVARDAGAEGRLWLCHTSARVLAGWRGLSRSARLVHSTRLKHMRDGPERRAAHHAELGIDAVNLHHSDWSGGLVTLWHRFERYAFGWDAQHERILDGLLAMGIDGVYCDHVTRMVRALNRWAS
jgi:glycerophosphoryl diester phosphodiesterase